MTVAARRPAPRISPRLLNFAGRWLAIGTVIAVFLGPLLWVVLMSLRPQSDVFGTGWPHKLEFGNYTRAEQIGSFRQYMINSASLGFWTILVVLPLSLLAGYAFARLVFFGRRALLVLFFFSLTTPGIANLLAVYLFFDHLHLLDTYLALVIVYSAGALPLATWIMRAYITTIPVAIEDAAMIDGCSRVGAIWRVVAPLAGPGLASAAVLTFVGVWQEYIVAQTLLFSQNKSVVTQGLLNMKQQYSTDYTAMAAGSILISIVPIALFVLLQRRFISGLSLGGTTG